MLTDPQSMWSSMRFTGQDKLFRRLVMIEKIDQICVRIVTQRFRQRLWQFSSHAGECVYIQWPNSYQLW